MDPELSTPETNQESTPADESVDLSKLAALESLLFAYGAPLTIERLSQVIGTSRQETQSLLKELKQNLENAGRGLRLLEVGESWQLGTAPDSSPYVEKLFKEDFKEDLTPASLETLAIITYRGPINRAEIDYIRGVNSSYILRTLLIRGLVSREPDPARTQVYLYQPSFDLLKLLGITSAKELPDFEVLSQKLQSLESNIKQEETRSIIKET